ncbi:Mitochondrial distribution and morphology protein 31, mitochondrial precursor [Agyrium rufum]|nr:Mitochondrial distribution and morphology protein 31, mitochondrial precursor [Agyrium rufum]
MLKNDLRCLYSSLVTPSQGAVSQSFLPSKPRYINSITSQLPSCQASSANAGIVRRYASSQYFTKTPITTTGFANLRQALDRRKLHLAFLFGQVRFAHAKNSKTGSGIGKRNKSSKSKETPITRKGVEQPVQQIATGSTTSKVVAATAKVSHTNKHLVDRLPSIHRPTKEELLAAATGFWSRLKVRFKWFSIRSARPFNADEIGAFFSWILLGHVLWIILGTTTFFSLAIFAVNTVFAQETLAKWVGNYLTKSSGVKIVFESAIVPKWGDGVITFRNVFVSRRPGQGATKVSKGSAETAAAAAAATAVADQGRDVDTSGVETYPDEDDGNYTQFDVSLETINVTLSFTKWFNSKGLLKDVEIKGVRGVIDRTHLQPVMEHVDPSIYKHIHKPGDFEIDSFKMDDLLVTVYQPRGFRPFSVSIFSCDLPQLRRQWLFYDFLSANQISGSFDESLFTIHPRQTHGSPGTQALQGINEGGPKSWKKHSRLRIDGLNIDHLNRGVEGTFSWIREGNVDIVADIMFPADADESIAKVVSDLYERMEATVTQSHVIRHDDADDALPDHAAEEVNEEPAHPVSPPATFKTPASANEDDKRFLIMDLRVHLNDVRAAVPIFTRDLSYMNNALIRPIVAYMNSRSTFIPINCRVVKRASDFDGSWTIFDSGLMADLSEETYKAFAQNVVDEQARHRRFRKVGLWSLQLAIQALFMGMAGNLA